MASSKAARLGEEVWKTRVDKINTEILTLTYGTLVSTLCTSLRLPSSPTLTDYAAVNTELDRMGYNIGLRLIEDFLSKTNTPACTNFRDTAEMVSKVGFKMFLNVVPTVTKVNEEVGLKAFSLVLEENPLADWVELPDDGRSQGELWFSNILCGVLRGALEMVQMQVDVHFVSDVLRGNDTTEMRVTLLKFIDDEMPPNDE